MSGRIRTIKPEWLEDELLALASSDARVLSVGLMLLADDYGNGRANLIILAGQVFPGKPRETLASALEDLVGIKYVTLYEADGQCYFSIRNWSKHQKVDHPSKPRIPQPFLIARETSSNTREEIADTRASRGSQVQVQVQVEDPDQCARKLDNSKADVKSVWEGWKTLTGHPRAVLDRKREARIVARLRDGFSAEQLLLAIQNSRNDPWLMGETTGRKYDGIETLLRDRAMVERLVDLLVAPVRAKPLAYGRPTEIPTPELTPAEADARRASRERIRALAEAERDASASEARKLASVSPSASTGHP